MTSTNIPTTMNGILTEKTGGIEVLQYRTDLPVPVPKDGEILVKNSFIGVNFVDTYFRTGLYPLPQTHILGSEAEGTVVSTASSGQLYGLQPGDRVGWMAMGGYAEYTAVPADKAVRIPAGIPDGTTAAAALQGLTALTLIREAYAVQAGDWILVHAAAGGVGILLCQLLRAIGARVIGTAGRPSKMELAKEHGAEFVINYTTEDWVARVKEITGGSGVAAVFDGVGAATFDGDLEALARKGSLVSFGNASGIVPPFAIVKLSAKNIKICRPTVFNYVYVREELDRYATELFKFIEDGKLKTRVYKVYPLKEVAQAHVDLEGRESTGKILLRP